MRTDEFGGAERFQLDYFKFINYERYDVVFGVNVDIFNQYFLKYNLPIKTIRFPVHDPALNFLSTFLKYLKLFNTLKPDRIVFNQFWLSTFSLPEIIAAFFITRGNVYIVVHDCPPVPSNFNSRLFKTFQGYFVKKTLAVSKASRNRLVNGHKFPNSKVSINYHGVDIIHNSPSLENKKNLRNELQILESDIVVVSTALLFKGKRIDRLLEVFRELAKEQLNIYLLIVGSGPETKNLKNLVDTFDHSIKERIKFLGFKENVAAILQLSDIFVLPSDSEGLPLACLEAMSCGLICVVTDCGGPIEIIQNGYNGFLVSKSKEGVLEGLKKAFNLNKDEKEKLVKNARNHIEKEFNIQKNIASGLNILQMVG